MWVGVRQWDLRIGSISFNAALGYKSWVITSENVRDVWMGTWDIVIQRSDFEEQLNIILAFPAFVAAERREPPPLEIRWCLWSAESSFHPSVGAETHIILNHQSVLSLSSTVHFKANYSSDRKARCWTTGSFVCCCPTCPCMGPLFPGLLMSWAGVRRQWRGPTMSLPRVPPLEADLNGLQKQGGEINWRKG